MTLLCWKWTKTLIVSSDVFTLPVFQPGNNQSLPTRCFFWKYNKKKWNFLKRKVRYFNSDTNFKSPTTKHIALLQGRDVCWLEKGKMQTSSSPPLVNCYLLLPSWTYILYFSELRGGRVGGIAKTRWENLISFSSTFSNGHSNMYISVDITFTYIKLTLISFCGCFFCTFP